MAAATETREDIHTSCCCRPSMKIDTPSVSARGTPHMAPRFQTATYEAPVHGKSNTSRGISGRGGGAISVDLERNGAGVEAERLCDDLHARDPTPSRSSSGTRCTFKRRWTDGRHSGIFTFHIGDKIQTIASPAVALCINNRRRNAGSGNCWTLAFKARFEREASL